MNSYLDLVKEYGKVHKKKNRMTIICIAIAVCLVTAIFGMADMELRSQKIRQINEGGNWHVMYQDISAATAQLIGARPEVAVAGWIESISGSAGYTLNGKVLCVCGVDEKVAREFGVDRLEGAYPHKVDEVLVNIGAKENLHIAVGDQITVKNSAGRQSVFTVAGFASNTSSLLEADGYALVFTPDGLRQNFNSEEYRERYAVQIDSKANMRHVIDDINSRLSIAPEQVQENTILLGIIGQSRDNYMIKLYSTAAVLFVLVLAAGILMIASSFNMNIMERIQFFGMLRCLGASKVQVKRFVLLEGLRFSIKGIPIGLLSGTGIVWLLSAFLKYVNPAYFSDMPLFGISWISLLSGTFIGLLTVILASLSPSRKAARVSPLSAINGNISQTIMPQSQSSAQTTYHKVEISLGMHHAYASKKNLMLITGSFAISIVLFLSFSVTVDFMHQAVKPLRPWTPDLSVVSTDNSGSIKADLLKQIQNIPQVKHAYGRMFAYDVPVTVTGRSTGMVNLISYETNQFQWAEGQLASGNIKAVESASDKVLVVYDDDLEWKIGDAMVLTLPSGEKKATIAGILATSPFDREKGKQTVICSEQTFQALTGKSDYTILDIQLAKGTAEETVAEIHNLAGGLLFSDQRQGNQEARAAYFSFAIFIYGFVFIIALITVFNIINSMNMSISGRINQYGVMRAVGMSGKQLKRMVTAEAATYAVCGCVVGCVLGLPLHHVFYKAMITSHWGLEWKIPVLAVSIIIVLVLVTTLLAVLEPTKKIRNMDIVNTINAQ